MKMIDNIELEEIGYIENPQEIIVEYVNRKNSEYPNLTIDQFEKELIKKYHFKATKDTEDLYYYDPENGIYVKGGEWLINQECFKFNPEINTNKGFDSLICEIIDSVGIEGEILITL